MWACVILCLNVSPATSCPMSAGADRLQSPDLKSQRQTSNLWSPTFKNNCFRRAGHERVLFQVQIYPVGWWLFMLMFQGRREFSWPRSGEKDVCEDGKFQSAGQRAAESNPAVFVLYSPGLHYLKKVLSDQSETCGPAETLYVFRNWQKWLMRSSMYGCAAYCFPWLSKTSAQAPRHEVELVQSH